MAGHIFNRPVCGAALCLVPLKQKQKPRQYAYAGAFYC